MDLKKSDVSILAYYLRKAGIELQRKDIAAAHTTSFKERLATVAKEYKKEERISRKVDPQALENLKAMYNDNSL